MRMTVSEIDLKKIEINTKRILILMNYLKIFIKNI